MCLYVDQVLACICQRRSPNYLANFDQPVVCGTKSHMIYHIFGWIISVVSNCNLPSADLDVSSSPPLPTGGLEGILCRSGSIGLDDSSVTPTPSDLPAGCCKRRIGMAGGRPCLVLGDDGLELWLSSLISLLELKEEGEKRF